MALVSSLRRFGAALLSGLLLWVPAIPSQAAFTPVNATGAGSGNERCLAGAYCPASGTYGSALSILRAYEVDRGLAAGSLQRVDDALDTQWISLGGAQAQAIARYSSATAVLGIGLVSSPGSYAAVTGALANARVQVQNPAAFAGTPRSQDFAGFASGWADITVAANRAFVFVLGQIGSSVRLGSDSGVSGYTNSGRPQDYMVTYRVAGSDRYLVAWEDNYRRTGGGAPGDYDYNDYVVELNNVRPFANQPGGGFGTMDLTPVPLPAGFALLASGLALFGATARRRRLRPA